MRCPFPGMDPFIENEEWPYFHVGLTVEIARQIGPKLPDYYQLSAELIIKDRNDGGETSAPRTYRPDVGITLTDPATSMARDDGGAAVITPPTREFAAPVAKQRQLVLRDRRDNRLVTAIEVLSPANKGGGLLTHREKLHHYWSRQVTTIDIDLLRGGLAPYLINEDGYGDFATSITPYHVVTTQPDQRVSVWEIGLTQELPTIPVPLSHPDPPVVLNLQDAFTELYAYSTYPRRTLADLDSLRPEPTEAEQEALAEYLT